MLKSVDFRCILCQKEMGNYLWCNYLTPFKVKCFNDEWSSRKKWNHALNCFEVQHRLVLKGKCMGANGISWATPTPLSDCLLGIYSKIFLKYFEQNSLKFPSHYYVMVYIKKILKICHCQKNSNPFSSLFIA
jgi:hypothetical protein